MFTTALMDIDEVNEKTNSAVDEALIKNKKDKSTIYNSYFIRK